MITSDTWDKGIVTKIDLEGQEKYLEKKHRWELYKGEFSGYYWKYCMNYGHTDSQETGMEIFCSCSTKNNDNYGFSCHM